MERVDCCLCHDRGAAQPCPCCGKTTEPNPVVAAWEDAHGQLETALGCPVGLAYGTESGTGFARVTVGGRRIALVEADSAIQAIREVTALVLRYAAEEVAA